MALSAEVELASTRGVRRLPLTEFITGSRAAAAARRAGDRGDRSGSQRARALDVRQARRAPLPGDLYRDGGGDAGHADDGRIDFAGIAVGACSPVARRISTLEARLIGRALNAGLADLVRPADLGELSPVSDVRGTAEYRREAALTLVRRALRELADE
jgi:N-methylhydantoinase B